MKGVLPPSSLFCPGPTHLHSGQREVAPTPRREETQGQGCLFPHPRKQDASESDHRVTFGAAGALQGPLRACPGLCATRGRAGSQSAGRVDRGTAGERPGGNRRRKGRSHRVRGSGLSDDLASRYQGGRPRKPMPRKQNELVTHVVRLWYNRQKHIALRGFVMTSG